MKLSLLSFLGVGTLELYEFHMQDPKLGYHIKEMVKIKNCRYKLKVGHYPTFSYSDERRTNKALKYVKRMLPRFCAVTYYNAKPSKIRLAKQIHTLIFTFSHANFLSTVLTAAQYLGYERNPPCIIQSSQSGMRIQTQF